MKLIVSNAFITRLAHAETKAGSRVMKNKRTHTKKKEI